MIISFYTFSSFISLRGAEVSMVLAVQDVAKPPLWTASSLAFDISFSTKSKRKRYPTSLRFTFALAGFIKVYLVKRKKMILEKNRMSVFRQLVPNRGCLWRPVEIVDGGMSYRKNRNIRCGGSKTTSSSPYSLH